MSVKERRMERWAALCAAVWLFACSAAPRQASAPSKPAARAVSPAIASSTATGRTPLAPSPATSANARPLPPPVVSSPMAGDPTGATLAEARLVASGCAKLELAARRQAERHIAELRHAIADEYRSWAAGQPDCWREYKEFQQDSEGGGLGGLSATGRSSGQGYGSGSGRLGGSHTASTAPRTAASASGTNNQIANVDEADIVKTDGRYVYLALNGALRIVEALAPKVVSVTKLGEKVEELFVEGDRAVVYTSQGGSGRPACTYGYDCAFLGDGSATRVEVLDISNRAAPRRVRTLELSGSLIAARRIGHAIHTVVSEGNLDTLNYTFWPEDLERCGVKEARVKERLAALERENIAKIRAAARLPTLRDGKKEQRLCEHALTPPLDEGDAYTTLVSFDMTDDHTPPVTVTLQSNPGPVFASATALYLATSQQQAARNSPDRPGSGYSFYRSGDEVSDIHKFKLDEHPVDTRYVGTGVVPGHALNQFSMDEYYGYLRIATTRGRVPSPDVSSAVSILTESPEGNLVRVGAIDGIAPREDIRSVRFDDDRAYVVTFKKTDPLFVLDLYRADQPKILGELQISGFSSYLHRIDPNHLLSIGFDANDHGRFAFFDGVLLQLFDVTTPTQPKLLFREKIGSRGSSSAAATDHLAFNYFAEKGLLAVPMTVCEGGGDGRFGDTTSFSGLLVYRVSIDGGFSRLGGIEHGKKGVSCRIWWSQATSTVKRSVFLDDLVYSIATDRVKVQKLDALGTDLYDLALTP
jgi:hypothetical protein